MINHKKYLDARKYKYEIKSTSSTAPQNQRPVIVNMADNEFLNNEYVNNAFNEFMQLKSKLTAYGNEFHKDYDIFIFGDSVFDFVERNEADKTKFGEYLARSLQLSALSYNGGGCAPFLYKHLIDVIPFKGGNRPFLIELNLRSLSDEWYLRPSYRFEHLVDIINNIVYDRHNDHDLQKYFFSHYFYIKFSDYMQNITSKFTNQILKNTSLPYRKNFSNNQAFCYCYPSRFIKQRIINLVETINKLKKRNFQPLIFINPITVFSLNLKNEEKLLIKNNIDYIKYILSALKIKYFEYSNFFTHENYADCCIDTEHLKSKGRQLLAHALAESLNINKSEKASFNFYQIPCILPKQMQTSSEICKKI